MVVLRVLEGKRRGGDSTIMLYGCCGATKGGTTWSMAATDASVGGVKHSRKEA